MYRGSLCPGGCGHPLTESTSHWETGPQYDAKKVNCRACAAREEAKRAIAPPAPGTAAPDEGSRLWLVNKMKG
jgi:hypothetical protein